MGGVSSREKFFRSKEDFEMYSVVVLMALGGSVDVPDFGRKGSCGGCYGGGRHSRRGGRGGCCGSGGGCYGGGGYGYGGCGGGGGGCYGGGGYGGGCGGGYGGISAGCYGVPVGGGCYGGGVGMPYAPSSGAKPMPGPAVKPDKKTSGGVDLEVAAPATIVVAVPADAKLTIDDYVARATTSERTFVSPALPVGKDFHYTLKAEFKDNGQVHTKTQTVTRPRRTGDARQPRADDDRLVRRCSLTPVSASSGPFSDASAKRR